MLFRIIMSLMLLVCSACVARYEFKERLVPTHDVSYMTTVLKLEEQYGINDQATVEATLHGHITYITSYYPQLQHSGEPLPRVVFWNDTAFEERGYGPNEPSLYFSETDTIVLRTSYRHDAFMHEVVHWLQDINGLLNPQPCDRADEVLAYTIELNWLRMFGYVRPVTLYEAAAQNYARCDVRDFFNLR